MNQQQIPKRPSVSPPPPPVGAAAILKSPASGYSKSILCAIKDLSYEGMNREMSRRSSTNSPNSQMLESSNNDTTTKSVTTHMMEIGEVNQEKDSEGDHKQTNENDQLQQQQVFVVGSGVEMESNKDRGGHDGRVLEVRRRPRERRSISHEPSCSAHQSPTKPSYQPSQTNLSQRTQSVNVVGPPSAVAGADQQQQKLAVPSPLISSQLSSRVASSISVRSCTNDTAGSSGQLKRNPSIASSVCSKEERSSSTNTTIAPKIRITICGKALYACSNGQLHELMALVKENPDLINYQYPYCYRYSCLHIAAKAGDWNIVRYLIRNGANLNAKDNWATPLHLAAQAGHIEMAQYLRDNGADASMRDAHGNLYSYYFPPPETTHYQYQQQYTYQQGKSATLMPRNQNSNNFVDSDYERLGSSGSSQSQLSQSSYSSKHHSHHHHISGTFKKPIKAVRKFINKM